MFKCSRLVTRLVEKKLVTKSQDVVDRRGIQIVLLPAGEEIVSSIEEYSYSRVSQNVCKMEPEEIAKVLQMIEKLDCWLGVSDKIK